MKKRLLSALLVFCMVFAMLPGTALAAGTAELPKLATPIDLHWGNGGSDGNNAGFIYWGVDGATQGRYRTTYYRQGETDPVYQMTDNFGDDFYDRRFPIQLDELGSGSYYFTVQNLGDGKRYTDSDIAISPVWEYTAPAQQLGTVTSGLSWKTWPNISWTPLANKNDVYCYLVEVYYSETENEEMYRVSSFSGGNTNGNDAIRDHIIQRNGYGYYAFRVRALSKNVSEIRNGSWSEMSPVYHLSVDSNKVNGELNSLVQDTTLTPEQIKAQVQEMETKDLRAAMIADQTSSGTTSYIKALEETVSGGPATVNSAIPEFNKEKVSIVGANLNTSADAKATLEIGQPQTDEVINENFENTIAFKFSMDLANVDDPENLKVPIKIDMPIPASINPAFLVLLHYHVVGDYYENIYPYVYYVGGQAYASFVLTSFSDFVMVEEPHEDEDHFLFTPSTTGGTVVLSKHNAEPGDWVNIYVTPDEGYELASITVTDARGWPVPLREMGENAYSFTMPNARINVNPVFVKTEAPAGDYQYPLTVPELNNTGAPGYASAVINPSPMNYSDVSANDWFYNDVRFCHERYIMNQTGEADGKFEPNTPATRAAVWTALSRMAGRNTITQGDNWYDRAMIWAKGKGITDGERPMDELTREEFVTMLWRYNGNKYVNVDNLGQFNDASSVSSWAAQAVKWAVASGLMNGSYGNLNPQSSVTRAEVAAILSRFCQITG